MDDDRHPIVVVVYSVADSPLNLSTPDVWTIALHQRAFGPRRMLVATCRADGQILSLAHCESMDPPELALECCLSFLDDEAVAAIVYSDEPVTPDLPPDLGERLAAARWIASGYGIHLVDWILCDDTEARSMRLSIGTADDTAGEWWDVPVDTRY